MSHVFPAEGRTALDAINVAHGVRTSRHLSLAGFAFFDIDTVRESKQEVSMIDDSRERNATDTPSNKYARPCCPLNAYHDHNSIR